MRVIRLDPAALGASRAAFAAALRAEGIPIGEGYVAPLYRLPIYRRRAAPLGLGEVDYGDGICPVVERLHERELLSHPLVHASMQDDDVQDTIDAFVKVHQRRHEL
jgi:perosamine synthetase